MVLLDMLWQLSSGHGWRLHVAHFNHQLRGRSSDADEQLVRMTCRKLRLRCAVGTADIRQLAAKDGVSIEMAARAARHAFLARTARRWSLPKIALAHHADDQVELFLLRILRGAGSEGLSGMRWAGPSPVDSKLRLIRPLLEVPKAELRDYARQRCIQFREDTSNASLEHLRNRVRQELIPLLTRNYQPALFRVVLRNADILGADAQCLDQIAEDWLLGKGREPFKELPVAIQRRVILQGLLMLGVVPEFDVIEGLRTSANTSIAVGGGLLLSHDGLGRISTVTVDLPKKRSAGRVELLLAAKNGTGDFGGVNWRWEIQRQTSRGLPGFVEGTEYFDADRVGTEVVLRHWQPGDRFQPSGLPKSAKLQDLFVNAKIPAAVRRQLVVATTVAGELWWVEGLRIAEGFKLSAATRRRLKWTWRRPGPDAETGAIAVQKRPELPMNMRAASR